MKILFVCTGNICRSPTAEGVMRHHLKAQGMNDVLVDSAGIQSQHVGQPPDPRSIAAAKKRGIDISRLRARKVEKEDFYNFDLIFAMDDGHYNMLRHLQPKDSEAKVALFLKYAGAVRDTQLLDPYYGMPKDFDQVLDKCDHAAAKIVDMILEQRRDTSENSPALWLKHLPFPNSKSHKYTRGHALVVGGELSSTGAARLAALSALRAGAGLVTVASPSSALAVYAVTLLAVMVRRVDAPDEIDTLIAEKKITASLIGPGCGVTERTRAMVLHLLARKKPCVLDADALTVFAKDPQVLFSAIKTPVVLTPHEGEFAHLFSIHGNRQEQAKAAACTSGAVVLLKGHETVIASPDGRMSVNRNAPPALATAGSGDVLSGIIAALLAQGMEAFEAACAGAWIHGDAASRFGLGLIAEDMPRLIPETLQALHAHAAEQKHC